MPLVPSFRTTSSSSSMLSFLLCSSGPVEDDDTLTAYVPYSMRMQVCQRPDFNKKPRIKRRRRSNMVIGSPTNFRHDVHLGKDYKTDVSYAFWDSERWRQELLKKNLDIPPLEPLEPSLTLAAKPNAAKRNSITPQKRKPVPSLFPLPPVQQPHEIPLPPTPVSSSPPPSPSVYTREGSSDRAAFSESSLPTLEPPSRGPSLDDDLVSLSEKMEQKWEELTTHKHHEDNEKHSMRSRSLPDFFHIDEPTM